MLKVRSCPGDLDHAWPEDLRVSGVRTDGGTPCSSGRPCDQDENWGPVTTPIADNVPSTTFLGRNRPNPFSDGTKIQLGLPLSGRVSLSVYDVTGRLVQVLIEGTLPAGVHEIPWDSRDASGVPVTTGVYFMRLETGSFQATRKLVVLRSR